MAKSVFAGFEEFDTLLSNLAITDDHVGELLMTGANIIAAKQREYAIERLGKQGRGEGITARSIKTKMEKGRRSKDGRSAVITFEGERPNGTKTKRNAEVAFINEYGCPGRGIPATHFVSDSVDDSIDDAAAAMREVRDKQIGG